MTRTRSLATLLAATTVVACAPIESEAGLPRIQRMVVLSDGDHAASTYVDGALAPVEAGRRDLLTTVSVRDGAVATAEVEVSNSVTAAPEVLALSPDGTTAFVAERLAQRLPGTTTARDLPAGDRLFAIDVTDLGAPRLVDTVTTARSPEAIAVHPSGSTIAVVSNTPETAVLQLIPANAESFGDPVTFDLARLGVTGDAPGPRGGVLVTNVQWHPSGRALAINVDTQNRVAFFTLDDAGRPLPWGAPVTVGGDPFVGRFTPDGRHYLTSNWGRDLSTTNVDQRLPDERSRISVVEVAPVGTGQQHRVVGSAETDTSAEGLAISPDGRWVATVNMKGTMFPTDSPKFDERASVSLLRRDDVTGLLTKVGDYPLDGVLPEGGTFDTTGRYFIATVFEGRANGDPGSGLQIYRVGSDDDPGLTAVQRIPLATGVHHVAVG